MGKVQKYNLAIAPIVLGFGIYSGNLLIAIIGYTNFLIGTGLILASPQIDKGQK